MCTMAGQVVRPWDETWGQEHVKKLIWPTFYIFRLIENVYQSPHFPKSNRSPGLLTMTLLVLQATITRAWVIATDFPLTVGE